MRESDRPEISSTDLAGDARTRLLPPCVLRIGVTGARELSVSELPRLRSQIATVLMHIKGETARLCNATTAIRSNYVGRISQLRLLSPLAEGVDRLVAELALDAGFHLECPLPFAQTEYENDFSSIESVKAFRALLSHATDRVLVLDGRRIEAAHAYEAVGRLIVRNCDLLIGIWDGTPSHGLGGTAEIIRYAANFGPPVYWIHATDPAVEPVWVDDMQSLHEISATLANEALSSYLEQLLPSPDPIAHHAHSWLQRLGYAMGYGHAAPLDIWWKERPTRLPILWRVHTSFIRAIGGASATRVQREMPSDPVVCYWYNRYAIADNYARDYAARYRSAWFWGLGLGAMSLIFAALATSVEGAGLKAAFTGFELCAMMLIILLVYLDGRLGWHTRSIEYRLLAELCRTQQGLSPLAWSIPVATMGNLAGSHRQVSRSHSRPRAETMEHSAWIAWLFAAWQRAAPLPSGQLDKSKLELAREAVLYDLIEDQINYHYERFRQYQRAGSTLIRLGEIAFLFVVFLVAAKLGMELSHGHHTLIQIFSLTAAILSAFSAAVVGIRTYSELDLLSEQSIRMAGQLELAKEKIAIIRLDRALASQDLGVEVANVARLMLQDLEGWTRLFRAKEMEAN